MSGTTFEKLQDIISQQLGIEKDKILENSPNKNEEFFVVPKVIE